MNRPTEPVNNAHDVEARLAVIEARLAKAAARRSAANGGMGIIRAPVHDDLAWTCAALRAALTELAAARREVEYWKGKREETAIAHRGVTSALQGARQENARLREAMLPLVLAFRAMADGEAFAVSAEQLNRAQVALASPAPGAPKENQ